MSPEGRGSARALSSLPAGGQSSRPARAGAAENPFEALPDSVRLAANLVGADGLEPPTLSV
jgi:hypothetical protein